jgi:hypothetical protein
MNSGDVNYTEADRNPIYAALWATKKLNWLLHGGQREAAKWWRENNSMTTIVLCARGWGKSWMLIKEGLETCFAKPNQRVLYACPSREQARQVVVPTAEVMLETCPPELAPHWSDSKHAYVFPNKSLLVIEGADDENGKHLRGPFAHLVLCDEQGFWRRPEYVTRSILIPLAHRVKGRIISASTPPETPYHEFVTMIRMAQTRGSLIVRTVDDNPLLTPERRRELIQEIGNGDETSTAVRRELFCEIVTETERAVVPEFDRTLHVEHVPRPDMFDAYEVIDLGMKDFTHCLFLHYRFDLATIVVEDEICVNNKPVSEIAPLLAAKEAALWGEQEPYIRISDNDPMEIAEFARQHYLQPDKVPREMRFSPADNKNPEALINRMRSLFHAVRIKIDPRCIRLIAMLEGGLWNERRTDFERIPGLGHLDGLMALAYIIDRIDYARNPEARRFIDPQTHAVYGRETETQKRFGALGQLAKPRARVIRR